MTNTTFSFDVNVEKFKSQVWRCFTARQIEDIQATILMYIEIIAAEEMNKRVYSNKRDDSVETRLAWVADFGNMFSWFLKNTWQVK